MSAVRREVGPRLKNLRKGLTILLRYAPEGGCWSQLDEMCAAGRDPDGMTVEDVAELTRLGWHWDVEHDCWRTCPA